MPGAPVPILIELRELQKCRTLPELLGQHFFRPDEDAVEMRKLQYMLERGRVALLFDGFDELAQRVTYDSAVEHFDALLSAAIGQAKLVVTSRTQHFLSDLR